MNLRSPSPSLRWYFAGFLIAAMAVQPGAFANPAAPAVRHGAAEFNFDNPAHALIQQGSDKLIVDWAEFNISAGELTQFIQPGSGSAALNRVMGALPSSIQGQLQANGRVLLINPNGVLIGPGGRVDTAGFIASTLDVSDADFLAGGDLNFQGDSLAKVVNLGTINAIDGGDIFLIAREVVNSGTLNAPEGTVGLAAGQQVVIAAQGEERVAILPEGQEGSVTNTGTIQAATAELKAAGGNEYALAVNNTGLVRAKGFEKRGGRIYLSAGGGKGRISNTGTLKARMADNSGGLVQITHAGEMEGAGVDIGGKVDAKGDVGSGGMVLVNAPGIHVLPGARIDVSGKVNGGQIALHSAGDEGTMIDGSLLADGESGDGGFIHVTGSFIGLGPSGVISANGGNGGGFVLLGADPEDGGSGKVESSQIVLSPGSRISANGMRGDGGMVLVNGARDSNVMLGGEISASSQSGIGGQVMAFGGDVSLGGTAMIDAGGYRGGGQVYIGGGQQGRDAGKPNAQNTSMAEGAQIVANALGAGDGGRVILWADRVMDFRGSIENRGADGGAGGFAEVSGLEYLGFNGTVDTGGGDLLLDPYNYIIGVPEAANLVAALALNNVTIDTTTDVAGYGSSGNVLDAGDITVNSGILYDSAFDLTFLAMGDANFNASVQNRNATGGDVNIVAGWDGTTAYNTAGFAAEDVTATTVFGNGNGSVHIGDGTQVGSVAVGSRSGTTNVFGHDVSLQGGTGAGAAGRFAQLGYQVSDMGAAYVVDGGITVHAVNDVTASGGDTSGFNYAQIGHVGADQSGDAVVEAVATSVIELTAGNDVRFSGGGGVNAYAQLGQGGVTAYGNHSGTTTITQANDVVFRSGIPGAYAQLGQGGDTAYGNHSGTTTITRVNDVIFTGGGNYSHAQLGQGGNRAYGNHSGTIAITRANDLRFTGGGGVYAYAQLGQGGFSAHGDHSGATTITRVNDVVFTGGGGQSAYVQLGHGGDNAFGYHSGTTTITQANDLSFSGGGGQRAYTQLGQGGYASRAGFASNHSGTTTIMQANDVSFSGGSGAWAYAQLGQGGVAADGSHSGNLSLTHQGNLTLTGVDASLRYALIGHGDEPGDSDAGHSASGDVMVRTGGGTTLTNAFIGHRIDGGSYTSGNTFVGVVGDLTADAASQFNSAPVGSGGELRVYLLGADNVNTGTLLNGVAHGAVAFPNNQGSFLFGQGPYNPPGPTNPVAGNFAYYTLAPLYNYEVDTPAEATAIRLALEGGSDVTLTYNLGQTNFGAVYDIDGGTQYIHFDEDLLYDANRHLNLFATGDANFNASVQNRNATGGDVNIVAGWDGTTAYNTAGFAAEDVTATTVFGNGNGSVHIGDGTQVGSVAVGSRSGMTNVFGYDVSLQGGNGAGANGRFAQLGFQVSDQGAAYLVDGEITVHVKNDVTVTGGGGALHNYAQIGHVGKDLVIDFSVDASADAPIELNVGRDIVFQGGTDSVSYAQLGHGGYRAFGNHSGAVTVTQARDVVFRGGSMVGSYGSYAQLGHGGYASFGNHSGALTVTQARDVIFQGGSGDVSYAQLGNGGAVAIGNHSGMVTVTQARDVTFQGGALRSYAQMGNGGGNADGNHSGSISLTHTGNLQLTGVDVTDQYALIGHGDDPDNDVGNTVSGDVMVRTGGNTALSNAFIGHRIDPDGSYTSGDTFIGVAGDLTADAASAFNSAPGGVGVGELRLYVGGSDNVNAATLLNGTAHGGTSFPNNQGAFIFGTGPYAPPGPTNPVVGNFAYYTIQSGIYNYWVDTLAETTAIQTALNGGTDVTLTYNLNQANFGAEYDWDGGTQFIRFDSDLFYDANQTLNLFATGDALFNASVQNRNATGGDVNIVAGWDGTTAYNTAGFAAEDVTSTTVFGNSSGSVVIGDGTQVGGVAVGSRSGNTNVFAYDVSLQGGQGVGADGRFAQLGFQVTDMGAAYVVDGDITVHAMNDVMASGGDTSSYNYAQIGHVGADQVNDATIEAMATSIIGVAVGNNLVFTGGAGVRAYAQLGQGGMYADGNHSGTTALQQVNDVIFTGGTFILAYAQLGQGGFLAEGNHSGNTTIGQAGDVIFTGGTANVTYAQLGQGGAGAVGNHSGNTTIGPAGDVIFTAGTGNVTYAQLGQGGDGADGNHSGTIDLTASGALTFTGQNVSDQYALIGHGDDPGDGDLGNTVSGDVTVRTEGNATLTNAFLGHLIDPDGSYTSGDTYIGVAGDLTADAASAFNSAPGGVGVGELRLYVGGSDNVNAATLLNGTAHGGTSFPNNQGAFAFGSGPYAPPGPTNPVVGNFAYYALPDLYNYAVDTLAETTAIQTALNGGTDVTLTYNLNQANFGAEYDWDGGTQFIRFDSDLFYDSTNTLNLLATGDALFNASVQNRNATGGDVNIVAGWDGTTAYNTAGFAAEDVTSTTVFGSSSGSVVIGDGTQVGGVAVGSRSGNTNVFAYDVSLQGGQGAGADGRFAQLGFQVTDMGAAYVVDGDITVHAMNDVMASGGGTSSYNYAQIGHVGADQVNDATIEAMATSIIGVAVGNNLVFTGGAGDFSYAQLGQGGANADGNHSGTTTLQQVNDVVFSGGSGGVSYAQLGQGGYFADGSHSGTTTLQQANDVVFSGGSGGNSYAQLGQGGVNANGNQSGTTTIGQAGDVIFTAGGTFAYAHLGQGGGVADGNHSGTTTIGQVGDVIFTAGSSLSYAQLGQGGYRADGNHSGTTTIGQAGDVIFTAGSAQSYAQLGQGGYRAEGNHSGNTTIGQAGDVNFTAGSGIFTYAQLGQGGIDADGNHSGTIDLTATGALTFTGNNVINQYALIGHGDNPGDGDLGNTVSGDVTVRVGQNASLTNAFLGHQIDPDGSYTSGNTFLGVGTVGGPETLTADANSVFSSAPTGQLRFYIPSAAANQIAAGTSLNGTAAPGPGITPNHQGAYAFGLGPYNLVDPGNFAFYTLAAIPVPPGTPGGQRQSQLNPVIVPGMELPPFPFRQDIRFIRTVVFERDSWLTWFDYGIEGFVDFLPNGSMFTLGSFELDPEGTDEDE